MAQRYSDLITTVFSSTIAAKVWLATAALVLAASRSRRRAHLRSSPSCLNAGLQSRGAPLVGPAAFLLTLPVFFHCVTILGFQAPDARVAVHATVGTFFYGVFAAKVLVVRDRSLPGWALPAAGITLASMLLVLWLTSSLWYFTNVRVGF